MGGEWGASMSSRPKLSLKRIGAGGCTVLFVLIPIILPQLAVLIDRAGHNCAYTIALVKLISKERGNLPNHDGL